MHYRCTKIAQEISNKEQCEVNMDIICLMTELIFRFHQILATDLETFSRHAKRSTVTVDDVFCFVRRNPQLVITEFILFSCPLQQYRTNKTINVK